MSEENRVGASSKIGRAPTAKWTVLLSVVLKWLARGQPMTAASGLPDQERRKPFREVSPFRDCPPTIAMLLLLTSLFVACTASSDKTSTARANARQTIPVTVAAVQKEDLPIYLNGLGSVAAFYTVNVKSRVDGELLEVKFREGEFVKKGDLLAV